MAENNRETTVISTIAVSGHFNYGDTDYEVQLVGDVTDGQAIINETPMYIVNIKENIISPKLNDEDHVHLQQDIAYVKDYATIDPYDIYAFYYESETPQCVGNLMGDGVQRAYENGDIVISNDHYVAPNTLGTLNIDADFERYDEYNKEWISVSQHYNGEITDKTETITVIIGIEGSPKDDKPQYITKEVTANYVTGHFPDTKENIYISPVNTEDSYGIFYGPVKSENRYIAFGVEMDSAEKTGMIRNVHLEITNSLAGGNKEAAEVLGKCIETISTELTKAEKALESGDTAEYTKELMNAEMAKRSFNETLNEII